MIAHKTGQASPLDDPCRDTCPVSGLAVQRRPGWTDLRIGQSYSASFAVIGGHILHSKVRGHAGNWGIPRFLEERERVLREAGIWLRPHVEIKDYAEVAPNHPRLGRVQFALALAAEERRGQLKGFLGYNGSQSLNNILNVAKRLVRYGGMPAMFVPDYEAAVLHALAALQQAGIALERPWRDDYYTRDSWRLELPGLRVTVGRIGEDIMCAELHGKIHASHLPRLLDLENQTLGTQGAFSGGKAYRVYNLEGLESMTWRARRSLFSRAHLLHRTHPRPLTVMVGVNRILGATVRMSRPLFDGEVVLARDMDEAMILIQKHRIRTALGKRAQSSHWRVPRVYSEEQVGRLADELLKYIAAINWDMPGLEPAQCEVDQPMYALYEAVAVIKHDFDHMVRERAEMQARMFRAAKVASLGTLAAGFAHELNNPLCAVLGFAQRLQETSGEDKSRRYGEMIERAAWRMSRVVNQLGGLSREPDLSRVEAASLNRAVEGVMELLGSVLERQRMELEVQLEPDLPPIMADRGHLQSLVQNLVTNARDALMELTRAAPRRIKIRTWSENAWVKLAVEDNGPGMSEEVMEQAFDPFYTTKEVGKGIGLGLYLVHRTVDQYNGSLSVSRGEQGGTRFEIRFPSGAGGERRSRGRLP